MKMKGKERYRSAGIPLLRTLAKGFESRVFGLDRAKPIVSKASNIAEAVTVKMRPIRNWMKDPLLLPKEKA